MYEAQIAYIIHDMNKEQTSGNGIFKTSESHQQGSM